MRKPLDYVTFKWFRGPHSKRVHVVFNFMIILNQELTNLLRPERDIDNLDT